MKTLYKTSVTANNGRAGNLKSDDGKLDVQLSVPKAIGGGGGQGTNPEQLFGGAYAACFGSSLQQAAKNRDMELENFNVTAVVKFGKSEETEEHIMSVVLDSYLPGIEKETAEELINKAYEICLYSKVTKDNIDVTLNLLMEEE